MPTKRPSIMSLKAALYGVETALAAIPGRSISLDPTADEIKLWSRRPILAIKEYRARRARETGELPKLADILWLFRHLCGG